MFTFSTIYFQNMEKEPDDLVMSDETYSQTATGNIDGMSSTSQSNDPKRIFPSKDMTENKQDPECTSQPVSLPFKQLRNKSGGNLELFENMFESWRSKEVNLEQEGKTLGQKLENFEVLEKKNIAKIADLNKTVDLLQTSIDVLHNDLHMVEQYHNENTKLKEKLDDRESQIRCLKEQLEQRKKEFKSQFSDIKKEYEIKLHDKEAEHKIQLEKMCSEQNEMILQRDKEICDLKGINEQVESEKQAELSRMSLEYENKLSKLQRQKAVASLNQQIPSSHQEIFRKKLQHLKSEHDREIGSLKQQIRSLQSQLAIQESPHHSRPQLSTVGPLSKKFRK